MLVYVVLDGATALLSGVGCAAERDVAATVLYDVAGAGLTPMYDGAVDPLV